MFKGHRPQGLRESYIDSTYILGRFEAVCNDFVSVMCYGRLDG